MEMVHKTAKYIEMDGVEGERYLELLQKKAGDIKKHLEVSGIEKFRVYLEKIGSKYCFFKYYEALEAEVFSLRDMPDEQYLKKNKAKEMRHLYEFKQYECDSTAGREAKGIIIGVKREMLNEYIRLHDSQPRIIHDLCYQNGFRSSSIYVAELKNGELYLLQFVEFQGEEDPELYENGIYREWLRITGECQKPLEGQTFWKPMEVIIDWNGQRRMNNETVIGQ